MMKLTHLGSLSAARFLREFWQKKPLLVRNAFPGFAGLLTPAALKRLACRDDVESRLVRCERNSWRLDHGPFSARQWRELPTHNWTVLVQGLNHFLPEATALLQHFDFVPHARIDDLMVSYAVDGGGVGPHFDSYDVFLLQGLGQRRWQISAQQDRELIPGAPLRILKRFVSEQEWLLEPGDMLYLPPHYAHFGVAVGECMTYSVGFRAPSMQELGTQFLIYLQDNIQLEGMYQDPDLKAQRHPGEIGDAMVRQVVKAMRKIHWSRSQIESFLGCYLSEPKPHVFFVPPSAPLSATVFWREAAKRGVRLDPKSRMLFRANTFYLNGEQVELPNADLDLLTRLADLRAARPTRAASAQTKDLLYQWYICGYIGLE